MFDDCLPYKTELYQAVVEGRLDDLNRLLKIRVVRDNVAINRNSTLYWAARSGHLHIVNRLLEFKAVLNIVAIDGNAALVAAAAFGRLDVVNRLLEVEVNIANDLLNDLIDFFNLRTLKQRLIFKPVQKNIRANGDDALRCAIRHGYSDVVKALLKYYRPGEITLGLQLDLLSLIISEFATHYYTVLIFMTREYSQFPSELVNIAASVHGVSYFSKFFAHADSTWNNVVRSFHNHDSDISHKIKIEINKLLQKDIDKITKALFVTIVTSYMNLKDEDKKEQYKKSFATFKKAFNRFINNNSYARDKILVISKSSRAQITESAARFIAQKHCLPTSLTLADFSEIFEKSKTIKFSRSNSRTTNSYEAKTCVSRFRSM